MPYYVRSGRVPAKRHIRCPNPLGGDLAEELMSSAGFSGPSSLLYRLRPPTAFLEDELGPEDGAVGSSAPLDTHRRLRFNRMEADGDYVTGRRTVAGNDDLTFGVVRPRTELPGFYRNGLHDELVVVVSGTGTLETVFGELRYGPLDMLYIPRGCTIRWRYDEDSPAQHVIVVETSGPLRPPLRYRDTEGHFLEKAPYYERDLHAPVLREPVDELGAFTLTVRTSAGRRNYLLGSHPFDVVGWDGNLYPFRMNMADFEAPSGLLHQMPDTIVALDAPGLVVCCVTPGRREDHPLALPAQPHHSNLDYDEILYLLCDERTPDRRFDSVTLHPRSVPHGPKPGFEEREQSDRTTHFAIMVDAAAPLRVFDEAVEFEDPSYGRAWVRERAVEARP